MSLRFVILEHRRTDSVHWDLMLERPYSRLRTWSLEQAPIDLGWHGAHKLGDHRLVYLTYEGPLSHSRGWVRRWDAGSYCELHDDPSDNRLLLRGRRRNGLLVLERRADVWRYRFQPTPSVPDDR